MKYAELWKRILNEGADIDDGCCHPDPDDLIQHIITAPIIVAPDEKAEFHKGENETFMRASADIYDGIYDKCDGIAMPFAEFWIEGGIDPEPVKGFRWGSMVVVSASEKVTAFQCMMFQGSAGTMPSMEGSINASLDACGRVMQPESREWIGSKSHWLVAQSGEEAAGFILETGLKRVLNVLQHLSCKNVSLEPRDNDPKQVRRAIKRHGGNPDDYRYHVLTVRPAGSKPGTPGQEIGIMPRHVCRGHFAEYGPEFGKGLLFGKYAGRFFVPPHIKGKKENGTVEKDYRISA